MQVADKSKRTYEVIRLGAKHRAAATDFLRKFFYHDEPLNVAVSSLLKGWGFKGQGNW